MKAAAVLGMVLIIAGSLTLAYFVSPIRLMLHEMFIGQKLNPIPLILGGLALVCGIALMSSGLPKAHKGGK